MVNVGLNGRPRWLGKHADDAVSHERLSSLFNDEPELGKVLEWWFRENHGISCWSSVSAVSLGWLAVGLVGAGGRGFSPPLWGSPLQKVLFSGEKGRGSFCGGCTSCLCSAAAAGALQCEI